MLNPLCECVGFSPASLTKEQVAKVNAFVLNHTPEALLLGVKLFPNLDTSSESDIPTGMTALYDPRGVVDMSSIGDSLFQVMAVSRILKPQPGETYELKDEYFSGPSKIEALQASVDQFPAQPATGSEEMLHHKTLREMQQWAPELGGPGSFVGVFSKMRDGDHRHKDYYIAARGTVPLVVQDLKAALSAPVTGSNLSATTYGDLVKSSTPAGKRVQHGAEAARRNVARVLSNAAEALGVAITRADDIDAHLPHVDCAPPEKALPDWEQATHAIRSSVVQGRAVVAINYGVVPSDTCLMIKDQSFFVVGSNAAQDGMAVFNLSRHEQVMSVTAVPGDTGSNYTVTAPAFKGGFKTFGWDAEQHPLERMIPLLTKTYDPTLRRK